jgi:hypothetical protein
MTVNAAATLGRLRDHARAVGTVKFEVARVGEFKQAPPPGLCFAVWAQNLGVSPVGSGLATSAGLLRATARLYFPLKHKPEDDTELKTLAGADGYLDRINGDFTLGGTVRNIDILGEVGDQPAWDFGHVSIDNQLFRIADLNLNVIFNDAWTQTGVTP